MDIKGKTAIMTGSIGKLGSVVDGGRGL